MSKIGLIIADTHNYALANNALQNTINRINPKHVLVYTDHEIFGNGYDKKVIGKISSVEKYNDLILTQIVEHVELDHYLIIQYDGFALNRNRFIEDFLKYDYIGAPWPQFPDRKVGNGGFSLRSKKLIESIAHLAPNRLPGEAEDVFICRTIGEKLEKKYSIQFADEIIASKFSYEAPYSNRDTFGFHGLLNLPIVYQTQPEYLIENLDQKIIFNRLTELMFGISQCEINHKNNFLKLLSKFDFNERNFNDKIT
jgi:hypothetical protein